MPNHGPNANPTAAERMTLIAVGGYGRGEMAPHSDIDIGFLTPWKVTGWSEQVIESMLYSLWDMRLKVGHSSRSLDEMVRHGVTTIEAKSGYGLDLPTELRLLKVAALVSRSVRRVLVRLPVSFGLAWVFAVLLRELGPPQPA